MAIQTKLSWSNGFMTQEVLLDLKMDETTPLFQFSEYDRCVVEFLPQEDEQLILEFINEEGRLSISPFERTVISEGGQKEEGYIPGNYLLKWITPQGIKEGFFTVKPQSLNQSDLDQMRECLETCAHGITRNVYSQKLMSQTQQMTESSLDLLNYLTNHLNEFLAMVNRIIEQPLENLEQRYEMTTRSKRPTAKSLQWEATKGARHRTHLTQQVFYEPQKWLNVDTPENRYVKHILHDVVKRISDLSLQCTRTLTDLTQRQTVLLEDIERLLKSKTRITNSQNMKKHEYGVEHEMRIKQLEVEEYRKKISLQQYYLKQIHQMQAQLLQVLHESWLSQLTPKFKGAVTAKMLKHRAYAFLYQFYQEMTCLPSEGKQRQTFPYHQTSKLFEFYNVLLVTQLLERHGFQWTSGWLKNSNTTDLQHYTLNAEEELWFDHDSGYRVCVSYDRFLKSSTEARNAKEPQLVSVNSSSRRPDVLIELFYQDEFESAMIIEAKYRKLRHIYHAVTETDVVKQLLDYRALNYYHPEQRMRRDAIDMVIVTYPNHQGCSYIHEENYDFKFIPISPTGFSDETEGVLVVDETLREFLERYMTEI